MVIEGRAVLVEQNLIGVGSREIENNGEFLYKVTEKNNICREIWIQERKFGFLGCFLGGEKLHVFANRNYIVEKKKS